MYQKREIQVIKIKKKISRNDKSLGEKGKGDSALFFPFCHPAKQNRMSITVVAIVVTTA